MATAGTEGTGIAGIAKAVWNVLGLLTPLGVIIGMIAGAAAFLTTSLGHFDDLHTALLAVAASPAAHTFGVFYAKANRIFPLTELFSFMSALFYMKVAAFFFRVFWSRIPFFGR